MRPSRRAVLGGGVAGLSMLALPGRAAPLSTRGSRRVADLVRRMTLPEKIGQMVQIPGGHHDSLNSLLDDAMLDQVRAGRIGSFLHVAGAEPTRRLQKVAVEESRLGIPLLFGIDVVHGLRTIFPVPLAMAAGFDPAIAEAAARVAASETAVSGLHWTFAPMADIARDPRWGRIVEGAGEDPWLGARMAEAQVKGFEQGPDAILAGTKHFGAYGFAIGGRDYNSADISERTLHEVCLPPYRAAVAAGSGSVMTAFNDIAGVPTTANADLIRRTLRERWGYDGLVVSDWNAIRELIAHGIAATPEQAAALALRASIDMDMAGGVYASALAPAVTADPSLLPLVDEAVTRILSAKMRLGLFDDPRRFGDAKREAAELNSAAHRKAARAAAAASLVLLKNERALPLRRGAKTALIGALADDAETALGSWRAQGRAEDVVTLKAALAAEPHVAMRYARGADTRTDDASGFDEAAALARGSEVALVVLGEDYDYSGESRSRSSLDLPGVQAALFDRLAATGTPLVVLLMAGRTLALPPSLIERAAAIVHCWLPGVEGGPAIADMLTGRVSPAGRLPIGMPRATGTVPTYYAHFPTGRPADPDLSHDTSRYHDAAIGPAYPFGHGLSYAAFDYGPLTLDRPAIGPDGAVVATIPVTNRGATAADEVVQLYIRDPLAAVAQPVKLLRGARRLTLAPGETRHVSFRITAEQCAYRHDGRWRIDAGTIELMAGASSADIRARAAFEIERPGIGTITPAAIPTQMRVA